MPIGAAKWWVAHPQDEPDDLEDDTVLLDQQGTGAAILTMPNLKGYTHLAVVIVCAQRVRYVIQMATPRNPSWGWTSGDSCGGPDLGYYTSGRIDPLTPPRELYVLVPGQTRYDVTLYGQPVVKKLQ